MVINEKGVGKNVDAATVQGTRAGTSAASFSRPARYARALCTLALAFSALAGAVVATDASARPAPREQGLGDPVPLSSLPPEAQKTAQRILAGGPFPFPKDGVVFGNYEKRLERRPRGYYHEYTVPSPGVRNRGERRIVCGGTTPTEPDACFYTEDHYNSFHRIVK